VSYAYDNNGNRLQVSATGGSTIYTYDSRNRLITATTPTNNNVGGTTTYVYTGDSKQESVTYPNNTVTRYDYDNADRVSSVINEQTDSTVISSFIYSYDSNGNRTQQVETQNGFSANQLQTTDYNFDNTNRLSGYTLTESNSDSSTISYTYDANYNRINEVETQTQTLGATTTTVKDRTSSFDANNRLSQIIENTDNDTIDYVYDNNGNTLSKTDNTQAAPEHTQFAYDSRNQLSQVIRGPPAAETNQGYYDYNYRGQRIRHLDSERGNIDYLYDGQAVLEERTLGSNTLVAHYRYSDRLISLNTATDEQYYHYSALRTTANLTNTAGDVQVSYRTDAWGKITQQEGDSPNRQVFTGQEHDENTGLIYFGARYYDPDTARFINQDSYLGESSTPPSLHRYLYAYGNPTFYIDPDGHIVGTATGATGGFFWGFGQMVGSMINDTVSGTSRSTGDYLSTWGQNIVGGAELGASFDVAVMSGGLAIPASGALGGAGAEALTFDGRSETLDEFGRQQATGAAWGTAFGAAGKVLAPYAGKAANWAASKSQALQKTGQYLGDKLGAAGEKLANSQVAKDVSQLTAKLQASASATKEKIGGLLQPSQRANVADSAAADFYVGPAGPEATLPSRGYRHMRYLDDTGDVNKYVEGTIANKEAPGSYFGFEKFETGKDARSAFQIRGPEHGESWSDARLRGTFDTLQLYKQGKPQVKVPLEKGGKGPNPEPITEAYPEYGSGGTPQLVTDEMLKFDKIDILPEG
jgi:RHS repeat-associated protein